MKMSVCAQEDVPRVRSGTVPFCSPCLLSLWSAIMNLFNYQSRMTGQTNSPAIDKSQRGICPLHSQETERAGVEGKRAK